MKKRVKRKTMKPKYGKKVMRSIRRKSLQKRQRKKTNRRKKRGGMGFNIPFKSKDSEDIKKKNESEKRENKYKKGLNYNVITLINNLVTKLKNNNPYGYNENSIKNVESLPQEIIKDASNHWFTDLDIAKQARNFIITVARVSLDDWSSIQKGKTHIFKNKYQIQKHADMFYVYNIDTGTYYKNEINALLDQYLESAKNKNSATYNFNIDTKLGREALGRIVALLTALKENKEKLPFKNFKPEFDSVKCITLEAIGNSQDDSQDESQDDSQDENDMVTN
jgi:hypothetical protein